MNVGELKADLNKFLIYYLFTRRHGSLRRELKVKTPYEAIESWFQSKAELFKISPDEFRVNAFERLEQCGEN